MSAITKLPHTPAAVARAVGDALATADQAVRKAIVAGQMLAEIRAALPHGTWLPWLRQHCPALSDDRAERWIKASANAMLGYGIAAREIDIPVTRLLTAPAAELTKAQALVQTDFFAWLDGKTIKDCLSGVVVEGDEPHRITRAVNGATHGGAGGDRKDFPAFIGKALATVGSHLRHDLTPAQRAAVGAAFDRASAAWPRWLCEILAEATRRECKLSDAQRAARTEAA